VVPADGQLLMLPVELTFALSADDLEEAGVTAAQIAGNNALFLEYAEFIKLLSDAGADTTPIHLDEYLSGIITITPDDGGGVRISLPFLLANDSGTPRIITFGGASHLVIYDGSRNTWLKDPVWLFQESGETPEDEDIRYGGGNSGCGTGAGTIGTLILALIGARLGRKNR
jgi:hypothetical protein